MCIKIWVSSCARLATIIFHWAPAHLGFEKSSYEVSTNYPCKSPNVDILVTQFCPIAHKPFKISSFYLQKSCSGHIILNICYQTNDERKWHFLTIFCGSWPLTHNPFGISHVNSQQIYSSKSYKNFCEHANNVQHLFIRILGLQIELRPCLIEISRIFNLKISNWTRNLFSIFDIKL